MRFPALGLLAFVAATPLPAQSRPGIADPTSVPFTTSAEGMLIVPATLGATISLQVILDTGAGLDIRRQA